MSTLTTTHRPFTHYHHHSLNNPPTRTQSSTSSRAGRPNPLLLKTHLHPHTRSYSPTPVTQFFHLKPGLTAPQMLVVAELDDAFLPAPDDLLVNLGEARSLVRFDPTWVTVSVRCGSYSPHTALPPPNTSQPRNPNHKTRSMRCWRACPACLRATRRPRAALAPRCRPRSRCDPIFVLKVQSVRGKGSRT